MIVFKEFKFHAAHYLTKVPEGHKCAKLHGHTYKVRVECAGNIGHRGWVRDFAEFNEAMAPLLEQLDHSSLNEILPNPTCEHLCLWIVDRVDVVNLTRLEVWETDTSGCIWTPE
jgi:6-pyruvoyltetrahydropterin/6-carboxytetrahydropterin synthase